MVSSAAPPSTPKVPLITVDPLRYPRIRDTGGRAPELKDALGFQPLAAGNPDAQDFPDLARQRRNAVMQGQHGAYGAAHGGMIENSHNANEDIQHVPVLNSAPWIHPAQDPIREVDQRTRRVDVLPTLLGLAGIDPAHLSDPIPHQTVDPRPGASLSPVIADPSSPATPANGEARTGVLFISDHTLTDLRKGEQAQPGYKVYLGEVEHLRQHGLGLNPGPVMQPCHLRCARTAEYKLVRYFDPNNQLPDQWELYNLVFDPIEQFNLVTWTVTVNRWRVRSVRLLEVC